MNINEIKASAPMRYWSLSPSASETQKAKLKKEVSGENYFASLKKDGAWYRFIKNDAGVCTLQSRTISATTGEYVQKQNNVPSIIEELNWLPKNTALIGEIHLGDISTQSSDVVKIMGCLPEKAILRQKTIPIHYYIFDILMYGGEELHNKPASYRIEYLQGLEKANAFSKFITFAKPVYKDLNNIVVNWLETGEEGAVLMHKDKPYFFGDSPAWSTIKFKQSLTSDIDLVIMGFSQPGVDYTGKNLTSWGYWENLRTGEKVEGNFYTNGGYKAISQNYFNGLIGGFVLGAWYGKNLIEVATIASLTDEVRLDATLNPNKYLGKVVEVNAMSVDKEKKSLRHAKITKLRFDKNDKECVYQKIFE